jgi:ribonuclease P protein component
MIYETHLSTEQNESQKNAWVSRTNENSGRPQSSQPTPPRWSQSLSSLEPVQSLLTGQLSKSSKLRKRSDFQKLRNNGQRLVGCLICIDWRRTTSAETRFGITASKKYGHAPERNRFKRLVREIFRTARTDIPSFLDLNICPRQRAKSSCFFRMRLEILSLLQKVSTKQ